MHPWSTQQQAIILWFKEGKGNLVVRARAGCGKTTIIIAGVKVAPELSILICAFSKIIQKELEKRIGREFSHIKAQTLHSIGLACIRRFRDNIHIDFSSARADLLTATVCGNRAPDAIKKLVTKLHTKAREIKPHAVNAGELLDLAIQFECEPDEQWEASGYGVDYIEDRALAAMELASNVQSGETIDGSDMIFLPVRNGWLTGLFDLVVVDEAQDMTTAQLEIAQGVLKPGGRICVVGDDKQAIFEFRGASSDSINNLKRELHARELGLTTTYRCGKKIVDVARRLVPDFNAGEDNPEGVVSSSNSRKLILEAGPGDFILSRVNAPLVSVAMKLLRSGKRTQIAGRNIGQGLITLVRKFRASSVPDFLRKVEAWHEKEIARLTAQLSKTGDSRKQTILNKMEGISDQAEMLTELADGAKNIDEVSNRITALFEDDGLGAAGMITCSSVHKAKGLEANKVFVLMDTIRFHSQEEKNIEYVAVTRAKNHLVLVSDEPSMIDDRAYEMEQGVEA